MKKETVVRPAPAVNRADIPYAYARCISSACPNMADCLRSMAWRMRDSSDKVLSVLNPDVVGEPDTCAWYRPCRGERYARGFTQMQKRMYPEQYARFMSALVGQFGRNPYFMRRRGEIPISEREQALVRRILAEVGADPSLDFDAFEYRVNWNGD